RSGPARAEVAHAGAGPTDDQRLRGTGSAGSGRQGQREGAPRGRQADAVRPVRPGGRGQPVGTAAHAEQRRPANAGAAGGTAGPPGGTGGGPAARGGARSRRGRGGPQTAGGTGAPGRGGATPGRAGGSSPP